MLQTPHLKVPLLIFGGGVAGLWILHEARAAGINALLLEANTLGAGQTVASQGILHGGMKYTLSGNMTGAAQAIADMPQHWRRCLAGELAPDLRHVRRRAEFCHLWRTKALRSRLAMLGARAGLRVTPQSIPADARPSILRDCPGMVARLDEQVIEPESLIDCLAAPHQGTLWKIDQASGLEFDCPSPGNVNVVRLINPDDGAPLNIEPQKIVLAAGAGNAALLEAIGLPAAAMQRRPLHMVMARGQLPLLNGHCVDGKATRVTITSAVDPTERVVWQVGGQIAEQGVGKSPTELIGHTASEIRHVLPGVDLDGVSFATYLVDRAEGTTQSGARPDQLTVQEQGDVFTVWPTKLVLAPAAAAKVMHLLQQSSISRSNDTDWETTLESFVWPRPAVALPPWEIQRTWTLAPSAKPA